MTPYPADKTELTKSSELELAVLPEAIDQDLVVLSEKCRSSWKRQRTRYLWFAESQPRKPHWYRAQRRLRARAKLRVSRNGKRAAVSGMYCIVYRQFLVIGIDNTGKAVYKAIPASDP
jgi:hypothetical protein